MTQRAYPLDDTEYYASDVRLFHVARTTGIFNATGNDLQVSAAGGMKVNVTPGYAYLLTAKDGVGGITYGSNATESLTVQTAGSATRYDYVAVRYAKTSNTCKLIYQTGTTSKPTPVRDANTYEVILAIIKVNANAAAIDAQDIEDTRLNTKYCGLVIDGTERVPTDGMQAQFDDYLNKTKDAVNEIIKGLFPIEESELDEICV